MKNVNLFTLSPEGIDGEYTATIVRVGKLRPIEGSDFLAATEVCGEDVVVRKDEVKEGDVMVYCRIETTLDKDFLSSNNLYRDFSLNVNRDFVESLKAEGKDEEVKKHVGFFESNGRVKIVKLRKFPSKGFLFSKDALMKWKPAIFKEVNLEDYLDIPYWDTINGKSFLKKWVPRVHTKGGGLGKSNEPCSGFDRIINFDFHYNTRQLTAEIGFIRPEDSVSISVKLHGTSFIMGNIPTRVKKQLPKATLEFNKKRKELYRKLHKDSITSTRYTGRRISAAKAQRVLSTIIPEISIVNADIYSSRTVIKNQYLQQGKPLKTTTDIWGEYYQLLQGRIPKDVVIYGEIIGYATGSNKTIQPGYDYKCAPGENQLMIYRVKVGDRELDIPEVLDWTLKFKKNNPDIEKWIRPIDLLYNGTLVDLFPNIPKDSEDWSSLVLAKLKTSFEMEEDESLCHTKVPREGIVVRIDHDKELRAFKLKSAKFLFKESKDMDKGIVDIEMEQQQ